MSFNNVIMYSHQWEKASADWVPYLAVFVPITSHNFSVFERFHLCVIPEIEEHGEFAFREPSITVGISGTLYSFAPSKVLWIHGVRPRQGHYLRPQTAGECRFCTLHFSKVSWFDGIDDAQREHCRNVVNVKVIPAGGCHTQQYICKFLQEKALTELALLLRREKCQLCIEHMIENRGGVWSFWANHS